MSNEVPAAELVGEPPVDAERGVAMLWRMAGLIRSVHWTGTDNYCTACGLTQPCPSNRAADEALAYARAEYANRSQPPEEPPNRGRWHHTAGNKLGERGPTVTPSIDEPGPPLARLSRRPPPPELVAVAQRDERVMRGRLAELLLAVRLLRAGGTSEIEVLADVYGTLRHGDPLAAALIGAIAIVDLAAHPDFGTSAGAGTGPVAPSGPYREDRPDRDAAG